MGLIIFIFAEKKILRTDRTRDQSFHLFCALEHLLVDVVFGKAAILCCFFDRVHFGHAL